MNTEQNVCRVLQRKPDDSTAPSEPHGQPVAVHMGRPTRPPGLVVAPVALAELGGTTTVVNAVTSSGRGKQAAPRVTSKHALNAVRSGSALCKPLLADRVMRLHD